MYIVISGNLKCSRQSATFMYSTQAMFSTRALILLKGEAFPTYFYTLIVSGGESEDI